MHVNDIHLVVGRDYAVQTAADNERRATLLAVRDKAPPSPTSSPKAGPSNAVAAPTAPLRQVFVHFEDSDTRLDQWLDATAVLRPWAPENGEPELPRDLLKVNGRKRKRDSESPAPTKPRGHADQNFRKIDVVIFGEYEIKCWYESPYQLEEVAGNVAASGLQHSSLQSASRAPPAAAAMKKSNSAASTSRPAAAPAAAAPAIPPPAIPAPPVIPAPVIPRPSHPSPPTSDTRKTRASPRTAQVDRFETTPVEVVVTPAADDSEDAEDAEDEESEFIKSTLLPKPAEAPRIILPEPLDPPGPGDFLHTEDEDEESDSSSVTSSRAASTSRRGEGGGRPIHRDRPKQIVIRGKQGRFTKPPSVKPIRPKPPPKPKKVRTDADRERDRLRQRERRAAEAARKAALKAMVPTQPISSLPARASASTSSRAATPLPDANGDRVLTRASRGALQPDANEELRALPTDRGPTRDLALVPATGLGNLIEGKLYVCDRCFKYMVHAESYVAHRTKCSLKSPPGVKVYQRGARTIWEVDGAKEKNLALFGKLFIEHKYVFFDVDSFHFYVLTDAIGSRDHVLGFYSKEKFSYDGCNLACIIILPPYQSEGYGKLLIEFSYELDRRRRSKDAQPGTPERPLSDLGLAGYLSFWTSALVRCFDQIFATGEPPSSAQLEVKAEPAEDGGEVEPRRRRRSKGYAGEGGSSWSTDPMQIDLPDTDLDVNLRISIAELVEWTNIRADDIIFTLETIGLTTVRAGPEDDADDEEDDDEVDLVISKAMVGQIKQSRKIAAKLLDPSYMV